MILGELIQKIGFDVDAEGIEHLHEKLEGINNTVKVIAGIEIAHALFEIAERFADMGEHLEATALAAGLTTTELQKLQFAASQNAVKGEELSGALSRLNRQLYSAKQGGKQAVAMFAKLGISKEQLGTFGNAADALAAVQDKIGAITDANERQAITMQLFGRGSSNMIKFLTAGSEATKELGDSAEKMGAVVSERGVKNLAEFEDAASGLGQVFKSFMATIGATFAPAFTGIIKDIEKSWAENLPMMQQVLRTFAIKGAFYLGYTVEMIRLLAKLVSYFAEDHMGLLMFVAKWAPAAMVAAAGFDLFVESLNKLNRGWDTVTKYAPPAWKAILWGLDKLQVISFYGLDLLAKFFGLFSPQLAAKIRVVQLALSGLTLGQFALALAALAALGVALHDAYEYFFNDVPFEKLWIGRLLKKLEPITKRLTWLLKPFNDIFMLDALSENDSHAGNSYEANMAAAKHGPQSRVGDAMPNLFGAAKAMSLKFDPNDPINLGHSTKTSVALNAQFTVNVPANMSRADAGKMVGDATKSALQDMLNDTHFDVYSAATR